MGAFRPKKCPQLGGILHKKLKCPQVEIDRSTKLTIPQNLFIFNNKNVQFLSKKSMQVVVDARILHSTEE
jgi:hypothetical protein